MNILVCSYEYPPIGGGGGVGAQQYAEAWAVKGHSVTVLTSRARGLDRYETVNGVRIVRVLTLGRKDRATTPMIAMAWYDLTAVLHVLLHLRRFRSFQVMNTHFSIPTGPAAWTISKLLRIPNVLTIIGGDIYDPSKKSSPHRSRLMRAVNRFVINRADAVIAISSDTKKRALEHYGVRVPIHVVNYGFTPQPPPEPVDASDVIEAGRFHLIAVGRLVPRKGFAYLIRSLRDLPEKVVLLVVGDGPLEADLRQEAQTHGVSDRVKLLGYQPRQRIYKLLREADCFVLSSLHEGLGIVVQEAMDAGLPVVATDNGGQVDLIQNPRNGVLVRTEDSDALAAAIRQVCDDPDLARSMGENNRADIAKLHIDRNCELYLETFDQLLGEPDKSSVSVREAS